MKTKFVCALVCLCFALASVLPIASVAWAEGAVDYSLKFYDDKVTKLVGEEETDLTSDEMSALGIVKGMAWWKLTDFVFETSANTAIVVASKYFVSFGGTNNRIKVGGTVEQAITVTNESSYAMANQSAIVTVVDGTGAEHALQYSKQYENCLQDGWECWRCTTHKDGDKFTEYYTAQFNLTAADKIITPAWNHNDQTHAVATAPTCTSGGNVEYYRCNKCYKYLKKVGENAWEVIEYATDENGNRIPVLDENGQPVTDYNGNQVFADYSPFLPAKGHNMVDGVCTVCGYTPPVEQQNSNWWVWLLVALGILVGLAAIAYGVGAILYKKDVIKGEFFAKIYPFVNKWY